MIHESLNETSRVILISDRWHVVHARWNRDLAGAAQFSRVVVSEHDDEGSARQAARVYIDQLLPDLAGRPLPLRDQVFVRKPGSRSFKEAHRLVRKK
jgi:hypothetical protein